MEAILFQLLDGTYDPTPKVAAPDQTMPEDLLKLYRQMERTLGLEFVDRWDSLQGKREEWSGFQYYRVGFRLGARLMLEALMAE